MTDPSTHTTKVRLGEHCFIGVTYRARNVSKSAASAKPTPAWVTAHKAGNLEHTAQPAGAQQFGECPIQEPQWV